MKANMKRLGWERSIAAPSLRGLQGRSAMNQNGQAAEEKKDKRSWWAGCSQSSSGFQLRGKYFSLDIPLYRTSDLPVICYRYCHVHHSGPPADSPGSILSSTGLLLKQRDWKGKLQNKFVKYHLFSESMPPVARVIGSECLERCNQVRRCHGFCLRTRLISHRPLMDGSAIVPRTRVHSATCGLRRNLRLLWSRRR